MFETSLILNLGAEKPFKLLHASDTHLTRADGRDDERKINLAASRSHEFPNSEANLDCILRAAKKDNATIVYAGDLLDFVSQSNLDAAREFTHAADVFACAGNHEFSLYVGEAFEDAAYRNQSLAKVNACFTNDIRKSVRVINGIKIIALDNSYYFFENEQSEFLKAECSEGLPVILLIHVPIYTPELHALLMENPVRDCAYLCGTPSSVTANYPEHRRLQQTTDEITLETCEFIKHCPAIKCILTGHIHEPLIAPLRLGLNQYIPGTDTLTHITVC